MKVVSNFTQGDVSLSLSIVAHPSGRGYPKNTKYFKLRHFY